MKRATFEAVMKDGVIVKVAGYLAFEYLGYKFVAHKAVQRPGWSVSEERSGASVRHADTRTFAIEKAMSALKSRSDEACREIIEAAYMRKVKSILGA